ncbi:13E12 repeat family protein [Nocardioides sp. B-3]|nr:13E12 repeat family protein [Nocardioides sp. B-3]
MQLGRSLDRRWLVPAEAYADGRASSAQTEVIAGALDALPDDVCADIVAKAERVLVEHAATYAPRDLRKLGRRILDVIAPEVGEEHERKQLEDEERHARAKTSLTTQSHGDGTGTAKIRLPDAILDRLMTYLHARTNPRRSDETPGRTDAMSELPHSTRLGHAFCRAARTPRSGQAPRPWRYGHHRHGHDPSRQAARRHRCRDDWHRRPHHCVRGASSGLHRQHRSRRPRWQVRGPRRRRGAATLHRSPAPGPRRARQEMPGPGMRHARRPVRGPPPARVVPRRED